MALWEEAKIDAPDRGAAATASNAALAIILAALLGSCGPVTATDDANVRKLDGYAGLVLGSSFNEAMAVAPPGDFSPYSMKECLEDMPMRGCILFPDDDLTVFQMVEGIPYALQLEFNRLSALTDITLVFSRRTTYDNDLDPVSATISEEECLDILTRTVDWVSRDYGMLEARGAGDSAAKTLKGNPYWIGAGSEEGYIARGAVKLAEGRSVDLFSHFLVLDGEPDCHVSISFIDAQKVERRTLNSKDQSELDRVINAP